MKKMLCLILSVLLCGGLLTAGAAGNGELLLTVSEIAVTLVGESENIYAGTVPPEDVVWESDHPEIIAVQNGVLEAVGVGSARIQAKFGSQTVSCKATCLADVPEGLWNVHSSVRQSAKRLPPEVDFAPEEFFADAVIIGDSVTYSLMVNETQTGALGHPLFLARKNVGIFNFVNYALNLTYKGKEYSIEDAVAVSGAKKVFLLLGTNDLGYQTVDEAVENYGIILDRIREKSPDVQIFLETALPRFADVGVRLELNDKIDEFNLQLAKLAAKKGCEVVDVAAYIENHGNAMPGSFSSDLDAHMNEAGSEVWMNVLRYFAYRKMMEETK